MAQKYTILKVILQIFSKAHKSDRGFTLIELIVGLSIMLIVSGLAMNALVEANADFSKEKRNIESSQNMSAILEMIGNDIKQAGENISDNSFPTVEFKTNTDLGSMSNSSKIIVRRALIAPLTLCEKLRVAISNTNKRFLILNQTGEIADSGNTTDTITPPVKKSQIAINNDFATGDLAIDRNLNNREFEYPIGSPVYVIEERVYTLASNGEFRLSIDRKVAQTLIKKNKTSEFQLKFMPILQLKQLI